MTVDDRFWVVYLEPMSTNELPSEHDVTNEQLAAMGHPVEKWETIVGCKHKVVEGTSRRAAVWAAVLAGQVQMQTLRWSERVARCDAVLAARDANVPTEAQMAQVAEWLATPGNVKSGLVSA